MLRLPDPSFAIHKLWLSRLLTAFADERELSAQLYFKGGTSAAFRGLLDRFSVDLDFDLSAKSDLHQVQEKMEQIFLELGLTIKDQSSQVPQYFLKYPAAEGQRNTLKIDVLFPAPLANQYETLRIKEIDRVWQCQTIETMFANKLVAVIDRYEKTKSIAGRDIYDIHHWLLKGYHFNEAVIEERRLVSAKIYLKQLLEFIDAKVTETIINQDINMLIPAPEFQKIRKVLKTETLMLLKDRLNFI